jgi:hypothetical protein
MAQLGLRCSEFVPSSQCYSMAAKRTMKTHSRLRKFTGSHAIWLRLLLPRFQQARLSSFGKAHQANHPRTRVTFGLS